MHSLILSFIYSFQAAAMSLREFTDEFLEDDNPLISVGKVISEQMTQMADFGRGRGDLKSKADMINTAKAAAENSNKIFKIAQSICKHCRDQKTKSNLQCRAEMIPTLSTPLTMLTSVRSSTAENNYAVSLKSGWVGGATWTSKREPFGPTSSFPFII